ncbi:hypothetical protein GCM10010103_40770 [Streptomyces paradoxus]|uniref:Uncharacterized protein n=1 Tax=Streptomyces paradoxus TaxID=66375 RepID=A0A7W9TDE1_9ACTN|nr:hypothetical protein [Streptomyces paradoxus]MBB6077667.1 hypothetical protein [Streptomyces paradoxus]
MRLRLRVAGLCESLLLTLVRLLLPARGRHRAVAPVAPVVPRPLPPPTRPLPPEPLEIDTPLVRPYLRALEIYA